jgi:dihydrofolate synthase/folylpolyglutamate synthase
VAALFARRPECLVPGLRRIRRLSHRLGDPQHAYPSLHITGTNGKTSTARIATSLLLAAGRSVGTYTSPHLQDVRERVRIDGVPVPRAILLHALAEVEAQIPGTEGELGEMVTFFEALTALGAVCFRDAGVDVGVIEVGKGGRWDATNVHDGQVAVIGTVGRDHLELGLCLAEVAAEKAGIVKDGATAVVGHQHPDADAVIAAQVAARSARLLHVGEAFEVLARTPLAGGQDLLVRVGDRAYGAYLPLHGAHQAANAACALAAVEGVLADVGGLSNEIVRAGLAAVRSPGRLEVFTREGAPPVVLDGAHNLDGAHSLVAAVRETFPGRRIVAVLGVHGDKDTDGMVGAVLELADHVVVTRPPCGRAATLAALAGAAARRGRRVGRAAQVTDALAAAGRVAGADDVIVVTGSLYLVGAARDLLGGAVA